MHTAPVVVVSRRPAVEAAVAAMREGAADYLREPCSGERAAGGASRGCEQPTADSRPPMCRPSTRPPMSARFEGMLGQCPRHARRLRPDRAHRPGRQHRAGDRRKRDGQGNGGPGDPSAQPPPRHPLSGLRLHGPGPTLLESELFGHVKGSFSGAIATKKGLFEVAHQGTLLLDEVANLSLETQGKLLRVLETRQVRKVGDTAEHEVDIRLIATTNRSLAEMVKVGAFRADLYYRLNVVPITLPPLRERRGDIPLLADSLSGAVLAADGRGAGGVLAARPCGRWKLYPWPGNVRELRNIVERLAVLYGGSRIEFAHLPCEIREAKPRSRPPKCRAPGRSSRA